MNRSVRLAGGTPQLAHRDLETITGSLETPRETTILVQYYEDVDESGFHPVAYCSKYWLPIMYRQRTFCSPHILGLSRRGHSIRVFNMLEAVLQLSEKWHYTLFCD
jgi:hypothetical protein